MKISRREFLLGAGAASVCVSPLLGVRRAFSASNPVGDGRFVVLINLIGGNDGVNTVVPTHLAPYHEQRATLALTEGLYGLGVEGFALHPALETMHALWAEGRLHIVEKVGFPQVNFSHFVARDIFSLGVRDLKASGDGRGWLGRLVDTYFADPVDPLAVVAVGGGRQPDFLSFRTDPLVLSRIERLQLDHDQPFPGDTGVRWHFIREVLANDAAHGKAAGRFAHQAGVHAHDLVDRVLDGTADWVDPGTYPDTNFGGHLKTIAKLRSADFGTRLYYTVLEGFDTHAEQGHRHATLLADLDASLQAFVAEMKARGDWEKCLILMISEFGRRNAENGSRGTDHGHGSAFFVAGGNVAGGLTGTLTEADLLAPQPGVAYDFREIYWQVVRDHLDLDPAPLFPEPFQQTQDLHLL